MKKFILAGLCVAMLAGLTYNKTECQSKVSLRASLRPKALYITFDIDDRSMPKRFKLYGAFRRAVGLATCVSFGMIARGLWSSIAGDDDN